MRCFCGIFIVPLFKRVCDNAGIAFDLEIVDYIISNYYDKTGIKLNACHPRDLVDQITDISRYRDMPPVLSREMLDEAWQNYFVDL